MKFTPEHFKQARRVAEHWRQDGFNHIVVVRRGLRALRCYPCRQQDVPTRALAAWDYYPLPPLDRLHERAPAQETASRAELWIAVTIVYGCRYTTAPLH